MLSKTVVSINFEVEGNDAEISALIAKLLGGESTAQDPITPQKKARKQREYTAEQRAAFRERMVAARAAKAKLDQDKTKPEKKAPAKLGGASLSETTTKTLSVPIPRTGHKVPALPTSK